MRCIIRVFNERFSKWLIIGIVLLLVFANLPISRSGLVRADEVGDKTKMRRQVASKWIEVGTEQYKRGLYKQAEKSFLLAQEYNEYLTNSSRVKLNELLIQTRAAMTPAPSVAKKAVKSKDEIKIKDGEKGSSAEGIAASNRQPVAVILEAEVAGVEDKLLSAENKSVELSVAEKPVEAGYIQKVTQKTNIIRGHTKAVVSDSLAKARELILQKKFGKAKEIVDAARRLVDENHLHLGDLYLEYSSALRQLSEEIAKSQKEEEAALEKIKRKDTEEAARKYRDRMAKEREKRIGELMKRAMAFQKEQRYEESLGQLESLLAIDPLNDSALLLKQTLEDTVSFRRQLEVERESDSERALLLREADIASIPYASELNYAKNWREIDAKRQAEEALGQDPANLATYKQLNTIVDLSSLTQLMSFEEAIEELKNSVSPPLTIVVLWRDLFEIAEIDQRTQINMGPMEEVPLGTALGLLLKSVSGGFIDISYVVENGVITIATADSLPQVLVNEVYDISVLLGEPAEYRSISSGGRTRSGGGRGGGGRSGGGRSGGGSQDYGEYFEEDEEALDSSEIAARREVRRTELIDLIQNTVEPDSWFEAGGEGTITIYEGKKLVVYQTRKVHDEIKTLLKMLRKSLGEQVSIEARFLLVSENFLEDIGLDVDLNLNIGSNFTTIGLHQDSFDIAQTQDTGVPGSMGGMLAEALYGQGTYNTLLDDLQVNFILRATQAYRNKENLNAPKCTVLSGETATFRNQRTVRFALPPDISSGGTYGATGGGYSTGSLEQNIEEVVTGTLLNVTPTITPDKKHVLLTIETELTSLLGFATETIETPILETGNVVEYEFRLPETEISRVRTRVNLPDGGTLLLGGLKVTGEVEVEAGVPVLSKIPLVGRLFDNRSKVKDSNILLILVKPTIILQDESDAEAIAAMDSDFSSL